MTAGILDLLRSATRDHHEQLERGLGLADRPLTRTRYEAVLERFFGLYVPLERALDAAGAGDVLDDWPARRKTGWLADDLRDLGRSEGDLASLPRCDDLPAVTTAGAVLGCLYVVEGATLGGAVITHAVRDAPGSEPLPHRFFSSYGSARAARWRRFRGAVEAARPGHDAVTAACATFDAFHRWCVQEPAPRVGG